MADIEQLEVNGELYDISDANVRNLIAYTENSSTASVAHSKNTYFLYNSRFYRAKNQIHKGDLLVEGVNIEKTTIVEAMGTGSSAIVYDVTIDKDKWVKRSSWEDEDVGSIYKYKIDIDLDNSYTWSFPIITIDNRMSNVIKKAGLSNNVKSFDGYVRLWSEKRPSDNINSTIMLISTSKSGNVYPSGSSGSSDLSSYVTKDEARAIAKEEIEKVDYATDEEVRKLLDGDGSTSGYTDEELNKKIEDIVKAILNGVDYATDEEVRKLLDGDGSAIGYTDEELDEKIKNIVKKALYGMDYATDEEVKKLLSDDAGSSGDSGSGDSGSGDSGSGDSGSGDSGSGGSGSGGSGSGGSGSGGSLTERIAELKLHMESDEVKKHSNGDSYGKRSGRLISQIMKVISVEDESIE